MSGIAAIFSPHYDLPEALPIASMTRAIGYCARDGVGETRTNDSALAYCATHSTAEARCASQPLESEKGRLTIVLDGYLANREEVLDRLKSQGIMPRNKSDAGIILQAWECMGADCLQWFDGEYAFVMLDSDAGAIYLVRDHIGLRPLFYHWDGSRLLVASHLAGVIAGLPDQPTLNRGYLAEIMAFTVVTPGETIWNDVRRVRPAHIVKCGPTGVSEQRFWSIPTDREIRYRRDREYVDHYRSLLTHSIQQAARTDLPLGIECSGGLDSSAVLAIADRLHQAGKLPAPSFQVFSLLGPKGSRADEITYARAVAEYLGLSLTEVHLFLPPLDWFGKQSRIDCDMYLYPNTAVSRDMEETMAAAGCRAVLNGQGGDHFLDGNRLYYHETLSRFDFLTLSRCVATDLHDIGLAQTARAFARNGIAPLLPAAITHSAKAFASLWSTRVNREDAEVYDWLSPDIRLLLQERLDAARSGERFHKRYKQEKVSNATISHVLDAAVRQASQCGIEMRTPMMSRAMIEFFAATPEHLRRRGSQTKFIHRQALKGYLPETVLSRDSKADFSLAFERHLPVLRSSIETDCGEDMPELMNRDVFRSRLQSWGSQDLDRVNSWNLWGSYSAMTLQDRVNMCK